MRALCLLIFLFLCQLSYGANITRVYLFPGQGSDARIFSKIKLDSTYQIIHINYPVPEKNATMFDYALDLSRQIDTTQKYIFIGVSMGGMLCSELTDIMKPEKTIILSSAKCSKELPFRYQFQKSIPLNKLIPKRLMKLGAQILQPIVEPDRNREKAIFKSMLKNKSPLYYKRTVNMIVNWEKEQYNVNIIHIHGANDHTIPIRNVRCTHRIEKGSHMMTLTRGEEINALIQSILKH